jgi:hypothetical protein
MLRRRRGFPKFVGGGDLYMYGLDKSAKNIRISTFNPGNLEGLAFWIKAEKNACEFRSVKEYVKTISPTVGNNIIKEYGDNENQSVIVSIENLVKNKRLVSPEKPNSLIRLEIDTVGRTRFPVFVSEPERLDVISIQGMIDPTNPTQRKQKLCSREKILLPSPNTITIYSISTNIDITYDNNLEILIISVIDNAAPVTEFSEIIMFSRKLSDEENEIMEGYLAYKKNEQYLLKLNHIFLPLIDAIPILSNIALKIGRIETDIKAHVENLETAVQTYKSRLPTAEILEKAPSLNDRANLALNQISTIRQNMVKGALYSRKQKTESLNTIFVSIQTLNLYTEPFTAETLNAKFAEFNGILSELDAYMKSLNNVENDVAAAVEQNTINEQIKKRTDAISVETLKDEKKSAETNEEYVNLRKKVNVLNILGNSKYDAMYASFIRKIKQIGEDITYYYSSIIPKWNILITLYQNLDTIIKSGEWLTYDINLSGEKTEIKRGEKIYHTEYIKCPYYKNIQDLYEKIRNQIEEGDIKYLYDEIGYIMAMYNIFIKKLEKKEIIPTSSSLFTCLFRNNLKTVIEYEKEFQKIHDVLSKALSDILNTLELNGKYKSSKVELKNKSYPISILFKFKEASVEPIYVRKINKHESSLSMIDYIVVNKDGTIKYSDVESLEADFVFPSLENIYKNKEDSFFTKKLPYCDDAGVLLIKKIIILKPYSKTENILDSISKNQVLPKFFHNVDGMFEIPRDSENGIYEIKMDFPQTPIILPKYAMEDGKYFICVNVGVIPFSIRIPGFEEDVFDLIGPNEICMYIYTGVETSTVSFYGRVQWIKNWLPYDTIYDVPRTALCSKVTDFSKYIFMTSEKVPLFDSNGYLVEALPDLETIIDGKTFVYNINDYYRACGYQVVIGPDMKISELEINDDWGEKAIPGTIPTEIIVAGEAKTNLAVFCSSRGVPALDEFGFAKYVKSPMLQINDEIVTRCSMKKNVRIKLNTEFLEVVQYGLVAKGNIFGETFRSNFVKPLVPTETTGAPFNTFFFVNSIGYPLVSPLNEYIQVENFVYEPPFFVKYTENLVTEYAYIVEDLAYFIPNKTSLNLKTFSNLFMTTLEEKKIADISTEIDIIYYRFKTGDLYIQYTITQLNIYIATCDSFKGIFSEILQTIDALREYITNIQSLHVTYKTVDAPIKELKLRKIVLDTSTLDKETLSTFDTLMKDTLNQVYKYYTDGKTTILFFKKIKKKIDKIRDKLKELQDVKTIEIVETIKNIQTISQNKSILMGETKNSSLDLLLKTCSEKKVIFDNNLKTLQDNLNSIPTDLISLENWVVKQESLIYNSMSLYKEIIELYNINTVSIFTQEIINNISSTTKKLQENKDKIKLLIEYKKKIALWLNIYPDLEIQTKYSDKEPIITNVPQIRGYITEFPPFEELENPSVKRDWYILPKTDIIEPLMRTRIQLNICDQIENFIKEKKNIFQEYNITANAPEPETYQIADEQKLKKIVEESDKTTKEHILKAMDAELMLDPIFKEYKNIRSDLRVEIQKRLNATASSIQEKWLDCTGKRTAIQTNINLLQPYFKDLSAANEINREIDNLFSLDEISSIEESGKSLQIPDYYANTNYFKMLKINTRWTYTLLKLTNIQDNLLEIQKKMVTLEGTTLTDMQETITKRRNNIQAQYNDKKGKISDGTELKNFISHMEPKVIQIMSQSSTDIPASITLLNKMSSLETELKTSSS